MADCQSIIIDQSINQIQYDWLCHLATFIMIMVRKGGQVTKPIILVKTFYKLCTYCMSFKQLKRFLVSNFLASADIKVFGHT